MAVAGLYAGKLPSNLINSIPIDFEDMKRFWGFEEELDQIRESLVAIADLVDSAEQKQETVEHASWWLKCLKEIAYETDDLLSELAYETTRLQKVRGFPSISRATDYDRKAILRLKMEPKLKKVNESLQYVLRDSLSLQLSSVQHNLEDMSIDSILDNSVVGRKADVAKIVNLLTGSCYQQLTIVSIMGNQDHKVDVKCVFYQINFKTSLP